MANAAGYLASDYGKSVTSGNNLVLNGEFTLLTTKIGSQVKESGYSGYKAGYSERMFGHPNISPDSLGMRPETPDRPV